MVRSVPGKVRKKLRLFLFGILSKFFSVSPSTDLIDPADIQRILLVRINYRIGNILFLTPLIKALGKLLPDTQVDVLIGSACTRNLLTGLDNVGEIYDAPRKLLKSPFAIYQEIKRLNGSSYDLIIDVSPLSTTNSIVTALLKAPKKLGFDDEISWVPLTHTISTATANPHMALKPLKLMEAFKGNNNRYDAFLDINLSAREKQQGRESLKHILALQGYSVSERKLIGIFRDARNQKIIDGEYWLEVTDRIAEMSGKVDFVDIMVPGLIKPLREMLELSSPDLRKLAAMLSQLDGFICGDTGPMHLASASRVDTVALFKSTRPVRFGTLGESDLSLEIKDLDVSEVAARIVQHLEL